MEKVLKDDLPLDSRKLYTTTLVCTIGDIVEHPGMCVQDRVYEAHGSFADGDALFVDQIHEGGKERSAGTSPTLEALDFASVRGYNDADVVPVGGHCAGY